MKNEKHSLTHKSLILGQTLLKVSFCYGIDGLLNHKLMDCT